jgi:hypothetical protein
VPEVLLLEEQMQLRRRSPILSDRPQFSRFCYHLGWSS